MSVAELDLFTKDIVLAHNRLRSGHGSSSLRQAEELTKSAQSWAETLAEKGFLQYSEISGVGENIVFVDVNGKKPSGKEIAQDWYRENKVFEYNNPRWIRDSMHFTQMVWKSTTEIGVGVAKVEAQDKYVVVVHYRPPGNSNMPGDFRKNVLPPLG